MSEPGPRGEQKKNALWTCFFFFVRCAVLLSGAEPIKHFHSHETYYIAGQRAEPKKKNLREVFFFLLRVLRSASKFWEEVTTFSLFSARRDAGAWSVLKNQGVSGYPLVVCGASER